MFYGKEMDGFNWFISRPKGRSKCRSKGRPEGRSKCRPKGRLKGRSKGPRKRQISRPKYGEVG